jgi:pyruvate kinase
MPNTKIVVTLGPATDTPEKIRDLLAAGADVFRLNASHGTHPEHARRIRIIREEAAAAGRYTTILLDLQGPKIRLGTFVGGSCTLQTGARFVITTKSIEGTCQRASTTYPDFASDVKPGNRVLLNDGAVELRALSVKFDEVEFEVLAGGPIGDRKGINLPGVKVSAPSLMPKDLDDLEFALRENVDMIALSFVRSARDVESLRRRIGTRNPKLPIIAKIEKPEGVENIVEIINAADGVMVARGDLGVEIDLERVPPIQKSIIRKTRRAGKFVITATQMLESMTSSPVPTRAEVSDVANAIYDGTDAVMLSAETSTGKYPVEAVGYMTRIANEAEKSIRVKGFEERRRVLPTQNTAEVVADAAYNAARSAGAAALVVFTTTGSSARLIARYRPPVCIYAITPNPDVARRLAVVYAIQPILAPDVASTDEMLSQMDRLLIDGRWLRLDDLVIYVAGQPVGRPGTTNLMKVHRIGEAVELNSPA